MPLRDVNIKPGLYTLDTDRGSGARWKDGNHVRFWKGLPQKIGGWQKIGTAAFTGVCRAITDWITLQSQKLIAIGTHLKLIVWDGGVFYDVTPLRASGTLGADPFTTTSGSTSVSVAHNNHGNYAGDYVHFSGAAAVAGITINGEYTVTSVTDSNNYVITHSAAANANAVGGGAVVAYQYEVHIGLVDSVAGTGWGAGALASGTWGTPRSVTDFLNMARIWSLDQWGEDLIACPRDLGIYVWDASTGTSTRATAVTGAPSSAKAIFVHSENRTLVALGAHDGSALDPLLVRWSDEEDYTTWTAAEDNTAGDKRMDIGNELYCAIKTKREILIFTDVYVWSMVYQGPPYTYGFSPIDFNGGLRSPNAATQMDGRVYWMGEKEFYVYDGSIRVLPCDVLNYVMDDLNEEQAAKIYAGINRKFGEVWWLYPSADSDECDRYVLFNIYEGTWSYGTISRTVFDGDLETFGLPYAADPSGYLYDHEYTTNDDGAALSAYLESADFEIGEGEQMMLVKGMVPDFEDLDGSVDIVFKARRYPQASVQASRTVSNVTSSTEKITPRIKGRQMALRIESDAVGDHWRMGKPRIELIPYGRK